MTKSNTMTSRLEQARAAFANGQLEAYKPLETTGTDHVRATAAASWGPAMRR